MRRKCDPLLEGSPQVAPFMSGMRGNGRKLLEMTGRWHEMMGNRRGMMGYEGRWREMTGNDWKWQELTGNDRKLTGTDREPENIWERREMMGNDRKLTGQLEHICFFLNQWSAMIFSTNDIFTNIIITLLMGISNFPISITSGFQHAENNWYCKYWNVKSFHNLYLFHILGVVNGKVLDQ